MNLITSVNHTHLRVLIFTVLILILSGIMAASAWAAAKYGIEGQKAPELHIDTWVDEMGNPANPVRIHDLKGKVVYLYFFQHWCPGCQSHGFPTLKILSQEFGTNSDVVFLAVQTVFEGFGINSQDKLKINQEKFDIHVPMAHDSGKGSSSRLPKTMTDYRSGGTPWAVVIDKQGTIVFNGFHIDTEEAKELILSLLE